METEVDAYLSGSDVGNHLRDEEWVELGAVLRVLSIIGNLVLESLYTTNAHAIDNADTVLVHFIQIQSGVLHTLHSRNHGQLCVAVELACLLAVNVVIDIEVLNLASELCLKQRTIEMGNRRSTALAGKQVLPSLLRRVANRCNGTETCYYYSL